MRRLLLPAFCLLAAAAPAGTLVVDHAFARAALAGRTGVVYLEVTDHGAPDRLKGASSEIAEAVELHESVSEGGVARMRPVASAEISQGHRLVLAPGGMHLMLIGLKRALRPGDHFDIILDFAHAGALPVSVEVLKAGALPPGAQPGMGEMPGMKMTP